MKRALIALACIAMIAPLARANQANEATDFTFSAPVALPGVVLPAGHYLFMRSEADPAIVRVFSADRRTLYGTFLTIPANRLTPARAPKIVFREKNATPPREIRAWFYPGNTIGRAFEYPASTPARTATVGQAHTNTRHS